MARCGVAPTAVEGMAFCAQMQGLVLLDRAGRVLRDPMCYLDGRATAQMQRGLYNGPLRINGWNALTTLRSLRVTGGMAATAKDPLWKYHWVREREPELFGQLYKWLDVKDYLVLRCTGRFSMGYDSAHVTFLYDTRPGRLGWNAGLCRTFHVNIDHLPPVVSSTERVGALTAQAAADMGLVEGIPVFGGGGDLSLIPIGAGCLDKYATHIYVGTSGWVVATVDRRMVDISSYVASILGAIPGWYNYIAEQETSGVCLRWLRDHLALDEIGFYLTQEPPAEKEQQHRDLYDLLNRRVEATAPGAGGVIFTPWLHGNRSPWDDPYARGMFFNLGLETGKPQLARAVLEGVAFHKRWMLETIEKRIPRQETVRFVGGGARSEVWGQIMADITGRNIEVIEQPQNAGAVGAAIVCGVGLGVLPSFQHAKPLIRVRQTFAPRKQYQALYDRHFAVFKRLYKQNRQLFHMLNRPE
jgi:xylulokinase